jgi:hypothetical protein
LTCLGVSWAASNDRGLESIRIIRSWPGPTREADETWKCPSRIAYACENAEISLNQWGYQVLPKLKSYSWTKLLLDDDPGHGQAGPRPSPGGIDIGMFQVPEGAKPKDVVRDFLKDVYKYFISELEKRLSPSIVKATPMEYDTLLRQARPQI